MRLVLLGAPGSGKGTQANLLKAQYGCVHVSTGDLLRQNLKDRTELGMRAGIFMNKGELVPDDLIVEMMRERFREDNIAGNFLMDGFPRTLPQAEALENMLGEFDASLDAVLFLKIEEEHLIRRLTNRRTCRSCGKIWNVLAMTPETKACLECQGELYLREDDTEPVIRRRLDVYREQTAPLMRWYEEKGLLRSIAAVNSPEETFKEIQAVLSR
ncbi:MAG: adenylate kinase [Synergistaceae bacterium]|nr:adenylate kinase [Synergistaceae bacterium]